MSCKDVYLQAIMTKISQLSTKLKELLFYQMKITNFHPSVSHQFYVQVEPGEK